MKGSHTLRSVCCVNICVPFFFFACGSCDSEPTIRKRPAHLKSLSALSFSPVFSPPLFLSSSPFFPPLRFTRPLHTSSKGLPDTPLSEALSPTAPQPPHSVHVCVSIRDLTFSTHVASSEKRKWRRKNKKEEVERGERGGEERQIE